MPSSDDVPLSDWLEEQGEQKAAELIRRKFEGKPGRAQKDIPAPSRPPEVIVRYRTYTPAPRRDEPLGALEIGGICLLLAIFTCPIWGTVVYGIVYGMTPEGKQALGFLILAIVAAVLIVGTTLIQTAADSRHETR